MKTTREKEAALLADLNIKNSSLGGINCYLHNVIKQNKLLSFDISSPSPCPHIDSTCHGHSINIYWLNGTKFNAYLIQISMHFKI